eukprot:jgi/Chlat1/5483/Chrsp36S05458
MLAALCQRTPTSLLLQKWLHRAASSSAAETVVGLELHCQIAAGQKLFSGASTDFGRQPNSNVALFDAAIPGTLPVLNRKCVEAAVRTGFAIGGTVQQRCHFDRKHYFYPDLPHGFQITQQRSPIVIGGSLQVHLDKGQPALPVRIERLEQDTGKSSYEPDQQYALVDLNRAGTALMEIVTAPDMRSGTHAAAFVRDMQNLLRHIGTSDGNMEEGSLRVDVNVSVKLADGRHTARCEVKNLNSIRNIARAIDFEAQRHSDALLAGVAVESETRSFDPITGRTVSMRTKESSLDYRFMPEPDLPHLVLSKEYLQQLRKSTPELPSQTVLQLQSLFGLSDSLSTTLVAEPGAVSYLRSILSEQQQSSPLNPSTVAKWIMGDACGAARAANKSLSRLPGSASPQRAAQLLAMVASGVISSRQSKLVTAAMMSEDARAMQELVRELCGGEQLSDEDTLQAMCEELVNQNPAQAAQVRAGRVRLLGFFVGQVMKKTGGRANPQHVSAIFEKLLKP